MRCPVCLWHEVWWRPRFGISGPLLQKTHIEPPTRVIEMLRRLAWAATRADSVDSLLGIEATAARLYFEQFAGMIRVDNGDEAPAFDFQHRNRRPPRDPVNALRSLAYSLLVRDLIVIGHAVGFDPYVGFFHQPRFGRPGLALDLMEGFRPLIADSSSAHRDQHPHGPAERCHHDRACGRPDAGAAQGPVAGV
jgi:CRISPR-associated endonuclease Cas1